MPAASLGLGFPTSWPKQNWPGSSHWCPVAQSKQPTSHTLQEAACSGRRDTTRPVQGLDSTDRDRELLLRQIRANERGLNVHR